MCMHSNACMVLSNFVNISSKSFSKKGFMWAHQIELDLFIYWQYFQTYTYMCD